VTDLDEVLERFQLGGLEYSGGFSNHGPMAAEALCALGHPALLIGWVDLYAPRLPARGPGRVLGEDQQSAALGRPEFFDDWIATFEAEISRRGWRAVLGDWLPRLAPGLFAGAGHGLLRVAHGVRAAEASESEVRVREIAFGLAYWAGRFQVLPGEPGALASRAPHEVLRDFAPVPESDREPGLFFDAVRVLGSYAPYAAAVAEADFDGENDLAVSAELSALCREAARLYLANPDNCIAYVHVLTAPSALRLLLPHADGDTRTALVGAGFQAALALHAVSAQRRAEVAPVTDEVAALSENPDEIRYRAACSLREHTIKFAEACLREDALSPDPVLRLAAANAAAAIEGPASGAC
jgi:hypothetical protein